MSCEVVIDIFQIRKWKELGMVVYTCNSSTREGEAGGSRVKYIARPLSLKGRKEGSKEGLIFCSRDTFVHFIMCSKDTCTLSTRALENFQEVCDNNSYHLLNRINTYIIHWPSFHLHKIIIICQYWILWKLKFIDLSDLYMCQSPDLSASVAQGYSSDINCFKTLHEGIILAYYPVSQEFLISETGRINLRTITRSTKILNVHC
jgi:hypothetical protein